MIDSCYAGQGMRRLELSPFGYLLGLDLLPVLGQPRLVCFLYKMRSYLDFPQTLNSPEFSLLLHAALTQCRA